MSVTPRQVKNKKDEFGQPTGKPGTVYDVAIKYKTVDGWVPYMKRAFLTKDEADLHEAEMRIKLKADADHIAKQASGKQLTRDFLLGELERKKLRPSTYRSYKSDINVHLIPAIGDVPINEVTPQMLDALYDKMEENGFALNSIKYVHRVASSCFEGALYWKWLSENPASGVKRTFPESGVTYQPYDIQEMQTLLAATLGTVWELRVVLAGIYGLRLSEAIGLRDMYVDLEVNRFMVYEQLPQELPSGIKMIETASTDQMAPLKSEDRELPILPFTKPYFERQKQVMEKQKLFSQLSGTAYYDNGLLMCKPDGAPYGRNSVSSDWAAFLRSTHLRHIRFHDLRHTAASNLYELTGDFFGIASILGHKVEAMQGELGLKIPQATTEKYIDVSMQRKEKLLGVYCNALSQKSPEKVMQQAKYRSRLPAR